MQMNFEKINLPILKYEPERVNLKENGQLFQYVENLWKKDSIQNSFGKFIFSIIAVESVQKKRKIMRKKLHATILYGIISLLLPSLLFSQNTQTFSEQALFTNGDNGYKCFRIPAILTAPNGDLLAFAEGRVKGCNDYGDVEIVLRRSKDNGQTWSALEVVANNGSLQAGNPAPVVDYLDPNFPGGRLFLFYNIGDASEHDIRNGKGLREVLYITSTDNGQTWSVPTNITQYVHKVNQPNKNPAYNFKEDWRTHACTPGHAIQLTKGHYAGRLYIPSNHSQGTPQARFNDNRAQAFYSDDHGKTWKISEPIDLPSSNEAIAVELSDGRVMQNIRQQNGESKKRIVAISSDGGHSWGKVYLDAQLPTPVCQASIIDFKNAANQNVLLFSNPNSTRRREKMTVRASFDDGESWLVQREIRSGESAYSDLVIQSDKNIGLLYERGNSGGIHYAHFNEAWLMADQNFVYDLVIKNGLVYDGTGAAGMKLDIGIRGDKIIALQENLIGQSKKVIDAEGLVVSPGFVDVHTHLEPLPLFPQAESHIRQGVTTALGGPDGSCPLPLGAYLDELAAEGIGYNIGYLAGHNSIRSEVMQLDNRAPTFLELIEMQYLVKKSMEEGAFGISTGLKYLPGAFSKLDEVVAVSKVAGAMGGIYTSHLREEGLQLLSGVQEAIDIAEQAKIPVVLTHHKVVGQPMWGSSKKTTQMVSDARKKGLDVMIDQYPYTASYTSLSILIPSWSMAGGRYEAFAKRCENPVLRDSIKKGIIFNIINDRGGNDLKRVQFSKFAWKPEFESKTLYDWAIAEGLEPTPENGAELIIQAQLHRGASCIFHAMDEKDVARIMQHPQTMIASDGRLTPFGKGHPHPRAFGTFPRVLGKYVREDKVLDLATAIYKMTALPAKRMGLTDRGVLKTGNYADLTIFDPNTIIDKADFQNPHQYPEGIHYVFVNGQMVVKGDQYFDKRAGKVLRGKAFLEE